MSKSNDASNELSLQRHMGFFSCVGMIVGIVIGSGIFISPKGVIGGTGSVGLALIVWAICGVMGLLGALTFSELGNIFPNSGGSYLYIMECFTPSDGSSKKYSWWRRMIPFLVSWQSCLAQKPASLALQCLAISENILKITNEGCLSNLESYLGISPSKLLAACLVLIVTYINCHSATAASKIVNVFSVFKVLAIGFIIIFGIKSLMDGINQDLSSGFEGSSFSTNGLALAVYSGLWAFSGWDNLVSVTKELINPKRDLVLSMTFSMILIMVLYILINCAYFVVLTKEEFLSSNAVAVDFALKIGGKPAAVFIVASVAMSLFGSALGLTYTNVRLTYTAGLKGHLWNFVSYLHVGKATPVVSLLINALIALFLLSQSSILGLISLFGFIDGIIIALTMVSLLIIKRRVIYDEDAIKFPVIIPVVVLAFYSIITIMPFVDNPRFEYFYVLIMISLGVVVFFLFFHKENKYPRADKLKIFGQKILNVAAPEGKEF